MGLEPVPYGDKPLNMVNESEPAPEVDTGDKELDEAFNLIRQAETDVYRRFDYGGLR